MIYGQQQIQIIQDTTDVIGIRLFVLSQLWQPSTSEPLTALSEEPDPPAVPGGVILVGAQSLPSQGAMRTTWTFQGINGDGKSVTFKDRNNSIDYAFEPGFAQVPIQQHPNFQSLLDNYGGSVGNNGSTVFWDPDNTGPTGTNQNGVAGNQGVGWSTGALNGFSGNAQTQKNPMYGIPDWFRMEGTYRFRYASMTVPDFSRAGTIMESADLPGKPPTVKGRNCLFVPPPYRRRGTILDVTEMYWLSGDGGWPIPVYTKTP
jgi:hypothetical protein